MYTMHVCMVQKLEQQMATYTVKPLSKGHLGTSSFCPKLSLIGSFLFSEVKITLKV